MVNFNYGLIHPYKAPTATSFINSIRFTQVKPIVRGVFVSLGRLGQQGVKWGFINNHTRRFCMYAVGIDVSKGRSTMAVLQSVGKIMIKLRDCILSKEESRWQTKLLSWKRIHVCSWRQLIGTTNWSRLFCMSWKSMCPLSTLLPSNRMAMTPLSEKS